MKLTFSVTRQTGYTQTRLRQHNELTRAVDELFSYVLSELRCRNPIAKKNIETITLTAWYCKANNIGILK